MVAQLSAASLNFEAVLLTATSFPAMVATDRCSAEMQQTAASMFSAVDATNR